MSTGWCFAIGVWLTGIVVFRDECYDLFAQIARDLHRYARFVRRHVRPPV